MIIFVAINLIYKNFVIIIEFFSSNVKKIFIKIQINMNII